MKCVLYIQSSDVRQDRIKLVNLTKSHLGFQPVFYHSPTKYFAMDGKSCVVRVEIQEGISRKVGCRTIVPYCLFIGFHAPFHEVTTL
jgi:hypothetical protein